MITDQLVATRESDPSSSVQFQPAVICLVVVLQKPSVGHHSSLGIIFGISEVIPEMVPDDREAPFLGQSGTSFEIVRHQFWDCQALVLGSSGTSFGISRLFLGYKNEPKWCNKGCFRVLKGLLELP